MNNQINFFYLLPSEPECLLRMEEVVAIETYFPDRLIISCISRGQKNELLKMIKEFLGA